MTCFGKCPDRAAEILRQRRGIEGITARAPWVVAFSFGLMHGLGIAGGLSEAGLPAGHIPSALLFFSIGVETGHFLFIGVVLAFLVLLRRVRIPIPRWAELVPPYAIGGLAMFWFIQRIARNRSHAVCPPASGRAHAAGDSGWQPFSERVPIVPAVDAHPPLACGDADLAAQIRAVLRRCLPLTPAFASLLKEDSHGFFPREPQHPPTLRNSAPVLPSGDLRCFAGAGIEPRQGRVPCTNVIVLNPTASGSGERPPGAVILPFRTPQARPGRIPREGCEDCPFPGQVCA